MTEKLEKAASENPKGTGSESKGPGNFLRQKTMIAKNYIRFPEALRFQVEMFSNGYKNSPRIMRLMQVIFDWTPTTPQWFKDTRAKAKQLVKAWKGQMIEMFTKAGKVINKKFTAQLELTLFPEAPPKATGTPHAEFRKWIVETLPKSANPNRKSFCTPFLAPNVWGALRCGGDYRRFCPFLHLAASRAFNYGNNR